MEFYQAAQHLNMNKIEDLVTKGADINKKFFFNDKYSNDVLNIVSRKSKYKDRLKNIIKCISMGSHLDHELHAYAWLCIINGGNILEIEELLDKYPKMIDVRFFGAGQDGLCASLINNNDHVVKFLLQRGANPNQYTGWYKSTLHRAENIMVNDIYRNKSAEIIRNSEFAILLIKSAKFGAYANNDPLDTVTKIISQKVITDLSSDLQIELASFFW